MVYVLLANLDFHEFEILRIISEVGDFAKPDCSQARARTRRLAILCPKPLRRRGDGAIQHIPIV
jgi:hypothetical protein